MTTEQEVHEREVENPLRLNTVPYDLRHRISEFSGAEFKLFFCLLCHANKDSCRVWAGGELLRQETGLSKNGLDNAIKGLKEKGWIVRHQMIKPKNGQQATASTWCTWAPAIPGSLFARIERKRQREKPYPKK